MELLFVAKSEEPIVLPSRSNEMKGTKPFSAIWTLVRKILACPPHRVRRRATTIPRFEALEERTLLAASVTLSGLGAVNPAGSLVYQGTTTGSLTSSIDVANYDLTIDPQQTLAELATPTSGETLTITLTAPDHTVTTATSPSPGAPVLIPAVQGPDG